MSGRFEKAERKNETNARTLLDILYRERTQGALDKVLLKNDSYLKAEGDASKAVENILLLGIEKEQEKAVEKVVSAYVNVGAEYGRVAYQQGFSDAIELIFELYLLIQEFSIE